MIINEQYNQIRENIIYSATIELFLTYYIVIKHVHLYIYMYIIILYTILYYAYILLLYLSSESYLTPREGWGEIVIVCKPSDLNRPASLSFCEVCPEPKHYLFCTVSLHTVTSPGAVYISRKYSLYAVCLPAERYFYGYGFTREYCCYLLNLLVIFPH